jgi:transposase
MVVRDQALDAQGEAAMGLRRHAPAHDWLIGYDPNRDLPKNHLVRLIDRVVDEVIQTGGMREGKGRPGYDPRMCMKVLMYGYAVGIRSSRQLEQQCRENLAFLFVAREDAPSYRTLCRARVEYEELMEAVWIATFAMASELGIERVGKLTVDSTKIRANVSSDSVVEEREYAALLGELKKIVEEADRVDAQEEREGTGIDWKVPVEVKNDQMRDIVRRVRKQLTREKRGQESDPGQKRPVTARMLARVRGAQETLKEAIKQGRKHVSLTDPDAQMMPTGRDGRIRPGHSWEVAVDNGLVVVAQSTQERNDNTRLPIILEEAKKTGAVHGMDGDSGYYGGDLIAQLLGEGIDVCVPSSFTARDLQRGLPVGTTRQTQTGSVSFEYDPIQEVYRCPQGKVLRKHGIERNNGQVVTSYRVVGTCQGCPLAKDCLTSPKAKRRTIKRGAHHDLLMTHQERFAETDYQERYRNRGAVVETVFAFTRTTLGVTRWLLRGADRVARESALLKIAYRLRKFHILWAAGVT